MKKHKENIIHYEAIFEPNGAGYTIPSLPGLVTEGSNLKEAPGKRKKKKTHYFLIKPFNI